MKPEYIYAPLLGIITLILIFLGLIQDTPQPKGPAAELVSTQVGVVTNIWLYEVEKLDVLKRHNVKYLFIDIGGITPQGNFETTVQEREQFLTFIEAYQRENNHSFILLPYTVVHTSETDISDPEFRNNYIQGHKELIEMGYDGILVDIEPIPFEQRDSFVSLLHKLREELPQGSILTVYSSHVTQRLSNNVWEWDLEFYRKVAEAVDIVSAPAYDTDFTSKEAYQEHLKEQVELLNEFDDTQFLIAIPTHKPAPETSASALEAIFEELDNHSDNNIIGITVFAEWTATQEDWEQVEKYVKGGREQ